MSNEATRIMEAVMTRFKDGIPSGQGAVVVFNNEDFPTVVGDMEKIDAMAGGMFFLDYCCLKARRMFGERVYVVYRKKNKTPNIIIDKFSGREIFRELSWEVETPSFLGQSPYRKDEIGLNFIGSR